MKSKMVYLLKQITVERIRHYSYADHGAHNADFKCSTLNMKEL